MMEVIQPPNPKRPREILIAVWLMVFSGVIFLVKAAFHQDWKDPWSYLTTPLVLGMSLVWIYPILRRQNWARWEVAIGTFLCCSQAVGTLRKGVNWEELNTFLLGVGLIDFLASWAKVFFLFSKPANDWFRKEPLTKADEPPASVK